MRKEDELWKSNDTRGITRMSDDQRLGLTMIILPLKTTMEMKEATMLLGKVFKRLNNSLNPFETYEMIIHLQMNEEWNQIASEKMKESLERCKKKLEPFLSGSDGDGRTEKDQAKTIERRNAAHLKSKPELAERYAMAAADIFCTKKVKKSVEYNTIH
jgi:hypothetical protein